MASSPALTVVRLQKRANEPQTERRAVSRPGAAAADAGLGAPATLTVAELGRELRASAKTVRRMQVAGKLPRPVVIGCRSVRWLRTTIDEWLAAGCPDCGTFESMRKAGGA